MPLYFPPLHLTTIGENLQITLTFLRTPPTMFSASCSLPPEQSSRIYKLSRGVNSLLGVLSSCTDSRNISSASYLESPDRAPGVRNELDEPAVNGRQGISTVEHDVEVEHPNLQLVVVSPFFVQTDAIRRRSIGIVCKHTGPEGGAPPAWTAPRRRRRSPALPFKSPHSSFISGLEVVDRLDDTHDIRRRAYIVRMSCIPCRPWGTRRACPCRQTWCRYPPSAF